MRARKGNLAIVAAEGSRGGSSASWRLDGGNLPIVWKSRRHAHRKRARSALTLIASLLVLGSCVNWWTGADRRRAVAVKESLGADFKILPSSEIYLRVRYLRSECPEQAGAESFYRAFWFNEDGTVRRDSAFTYLEVEDANGTFCYQIFWSPQQRRLVRVDHPVYS